MLLEMIGSGTVLGLAAGLAPGPLQTLVISETLSHGGRQGIKIAAAPLITDLPIILVSLFVLNEMTGHDTVLGGIALIGCGFLLYLGHITFHARKPAADPEVYPSGSLIKGILANSLSPHPYLFWLSVGGPILLKSLGDGTLAAPGFLVSFYLFLVGGKVLIAGAIAKNRHRINEKQYRNIMKLLGIILLYFALRFGSEGLAWLGWLPS